jgi:hypothetical protein
MIAFTVHEPPNPPADRIERAERLEFVRDGFSPFAAALPPLWMVMNRLWLALFLYLLVWLGADFLLAAAGVDKTLIGLINLAANVVVGFEASSIRRWTLDRRSWSEIGTVVGKNRAECERRFFDRWLDAQPLLRRDLVSAGTAAAAPRAAVTHEHRDAEPVEPQSTDPEPDHPPPRSLWRRLLQR